MGSHRGAYARFSFNISELVREGENLLVVKVEDSFDVRQPRGKQRWKTENFGCWYVQTTGIWKSVWMEYADADHIRQLKITPMLAKKKVVFEIITDGEIASDDLMVFANVSFQDTLIKKEAAQVVKGYCKMEINIERQDLFEWGIYAWSPQWPSLYDLKLDLVKGDRVHDTVYSYFGMRDIRTENGNVLLNGEPIYQRLILDQGYWKDSHLTPPSEAALIKDIEAVLEMGYNGVRKHQKTEDERFLYWCDVKGLLVWSEVGAAYRFDDTAVREFTEQWMVIVNDGWEHTVSDIITLHDYEEKGEVFFDRYTEQKDGILGGSVFHCKFRSAFANGYHYQGQPVIISEFGGIAFNEEGGWGYGNKVKDSADFIARFDSITTAIKKLP